MSPVFEKEIQEKPFLQRASKAAAILGVVAFWGGALLASSRYPSEYDWRYLPVSNLVSPQRNPAGYLWASTGSVICSLCWLFWSAVLVQRRIHDGAKHRPGGIWALQFGTICMIGAAVLPRWVLPIQKGHEILAVLAFAGLCIGVVFLTFQTVKQTLLRWMRGSNRHALLYAAIAAGTAVLPIVLAGLTQAYVHFMLPELPWVNLSWRARGVPSYLSFAFWEWVTCIVLSVYMAILAVATGGLSGTKSGRMKSKSV